MKKMLLTSNYFLNSALKLRIGIIVLFFALIGLQFSCSAPETPNATPTYFAWEAFLQGAIQDLKIHPKMVQKTIFLGDSKEEKVFKTMNWEKEWGVFMEADINKPAYKLSYDDLSEDNLIWYSAKIGEKVHVKMFKMHLDSDGKPLQVEMEISQSNFLYETRKKLNMNIMEGRVQTYSIDGYQKIRFLSPTTYKLMGVLLN
jgi:hypothetical protein